MVYLLSPSIKMDVSRLVHHTPGLVNASVDIFVIIQQPSCDDDEEIRSDQPEKKSLLQSTGMFTAGHELLTVQR